MSDLLVDHAPVPPASYLHDRTYLEASQRLGSDDRLCSLNVGGRDALDAAVPFIRRALPGGRFDLRTPTGFPGPSRPPALLAHWRDIAEALRALGCVSVYLQCRGDAGIVEPTNVDAAALDTRRCRTVYIVDLAADLDVIRRRCRRDTRQRLNTIMREEYEVAAAPTPAFADAYARLASRNGFSSLYVLDAERWPKMATSAHMRYIEVSAHGDGRFIGGAFWGGRGEVADYVYSACDEAWPNAGRIVLFHVIKAARAAGYAQLNLGGGIAEDDALARFKASFGAREERWSAIRALTDPIAAEALAESVSGAARRDWFSGHFPPYRHAA